MSDGGYITEQSLFSYDDTFGDGVDCLKAGSVLKALSNGERVHLVNYRNYLYRDVRFRHDVGGACHGCTACVFRWLLLFDPFNGVIPFSILVCVSRLMYSLVRDAPRA